MLADNTYEASTKWDVSAQPIHSFSFSYSHTQYDKGELDTPDDARTELDDASAKPASPNAASVSPVAKTDSAVAMPDSKSGDAKAAGTTDPKPSDAQATETKPTETKKNDKILSIRTESYNVEVQAAKNFSVLAGGTQKNSSDDKNANWVSLGLKGQPVKDITVTAKFDEQHDNSQNTRDVADIAISNAKPLALGPIRDITITARYASLNDQRKLQNETMTGRASFSVWKNQALLDYGGFTKENGDSTVSRVYSFSTDPNPKKWFHGSFLYKQKSLVTGEDQIIRRFQADWKLAKTTNFVYTYGTLPEDDNGNVTPLTTLDLAFKHAISDRFTGEFFYRINNNTATKVLTRSLGLGLEGRMGAKTKYAFAYSLDANGLADRYIRGNQYRLAFDQQISGDKFFTLSANLRTHDSANQKDDLVANLDFRTRF